MSEHQSIANETIIQNGQIQEQLALPHQFETHNPHNSHDPMHQFEILPVNGFEWNLFGFDISITNSTLAMFGITSILIVGLSLLVGKLTVVPNKRQSTAEVMYNFIKSLVSNNIPSGGTKFTPLVFSLFFFIFAANAFGLLPYSFTITSHIAVTAALACIIFLMNLSIGIYKNGPIGFFANLVPSGVPKAFAPLMLIIEFFAYLARPVTLAVRLAVNMVAGHTMMKVIAGFVASMGAFGLIPVLFNSALVGFEFFVAGLQAYIFSMLACIYINDALSHH
jgi:F-type H+-transporting ATPase subunit a